MLGLPWPAVGEGGLDAGAAWQAGQQDRLMLVPRVIHAVSLGSPPAQDLRLRFWRACCPIQSRPASRAPGPGQGPCSTLSWLYSRPHGTHSSPAGQAWPDAPSEEMEEQLQYRSRTSEQVGGRTGDRTWPASSCQLGSCCWSDPLRAVPPALRPRRACWPSWQPPQPIGLVCRLYDARSIATAMSKLCPRAQAYSACSQTAHRHHSSSDHPVQLSTASLSRAHSTPEPLVMSCQSLL